MVRTYDDAAIAARVIARRARYRGHNPCKASTHAERRGRSLLRNAHDREPGDERGERRATVRQNRPTPPARLTHCARGRSSPRFAAAPAPPCTTLNRSRLQSVGDRLTAVVARVVATRSSGIGRPSSMAARQRRQLVVGRAPQAVLDLRTEVFACVFCKGSVARAGREECLLDLSVGQKPMALVLADPARHYERRLMAPIAKRRHARCQSLKLCEGLAAIAFELVWRRQTRPMQLRLGRRLQRIDDPPGQRPDGRPLR